MQLPQGRASSFPQQSLVKRGMEELSCDGADSPLWKEQLGALSCPPSPSTAFHHTQTVRGNIEPNIGANRTALKLQDFRF